VTARVWHHCLGRLAFVDVVFLELGAVLPIHDLVIVSWTGASYSARLNVAVVWTLGLNDGRYIG